jgi:hypothetical protein
MAMEERIARARDIDEVRRTVRTTAPDSPELIRMKLN